MPRYAKLTTPAKGESIKVSNGTLKVPDHPIIPFVEGDGTGPDIWRSSQRVFDAAIAKAYRGKRSIVWFEVYAGEKANTVYGPNTWLHDDTLEAIREHTVAIKGPLTTPVGGGIRSINVEPILRAINRFMIPIDRLRVEAHIGSETKIGYIRLCQLSRIRIVRTKAKIGGNGKANPHQKIVPAGNNTRPRVAPDL